MADPNLVTINTRIGNTTYPVLYHITDEGAYTPVVYVF